MPRYNMRTLRGERVVKKKEGERIKRWESDYERFVNDARNVLSVEEVIKEIAQTFEENAIEQEKVSLICPLTKERIVVPVRYRTCRHLQCFDLKGFLAMKSKRNFLECPICNTKVDRELTGLRIDKFFQKMLSDVNGATEIEIFGDSTFKAAFSQSALIIPKVIDSEEPYEPNYSTTNFDEVKLEDGTLRTNIAICNLLVPTRLSCLQTLTSIEELDSVSSFDIDNEANESEAETQNAHFFDTPMTDDITVQAEHSANAK
ncbi:MIZ/SP-RING zinc finger domain-containing protein [Ditylenchus destructor]|nr:MIZ/SP-RING zinc finger domain-containing protein [Ditylenchus destructor]